MNLNAALAKISDLEKVRSQRVNCSKSVQAQENIKLKKVSLPLVFPDWSDRNG
jgi:hypothetical protein